MRLKIVDPGLGRDAYLPFLLLADDSEQQVRGYMQQGILFVAEDDGRDVGVVLAVPAAVRWFAHGARCRRFGAPFPA